MHKIFFAGIDGSGKSSCLDLLVSWLESRYCILKEVDPDPSTVFKGERYFFLNKYYRLLEYIKPRTSKYHFRGFYLILRFLYILMVSRYLESYKKSDLVIYGNDIELHPSVYIKYNFPFTGYINKWLKFKIFNLLLGSKRNFFHFLSRYWSRDCSEEDIW